MAFIREETLQFPTAPIAVAYSSGSRFGSAVAHSGYDVTDFHETERISNPFGDANYITSTSLNLWMGSSPVPVQSSSHPRSENISSLEESAVDDRDAAYEDEPGNKNVRQGCQSAVKLFSFLALAVVGTGTLGIAQIMSILVLQGDSTLFASGSTSPANSTATVQASRDILLLVFCMLPQLLTLFVALWIYFGALHVRDVKLKWRSCLSIFFWSTLESCCVSILVFDALPSLGPLLHTAISGLVLLINSQISFWRHNIRTCRFFVGGICTLASCALIGTSGYVIFLRQSASAWRGVVALLILSLAWSRWSTQSQLHAYKSREIPVIKRALSLKASSPKILNDDNSSVSSTTPSRVTVNDDLREWVRYRAAFGAALLKLIISPLAFAVVLRLIRGVAFSTLISNLRLVSWSSFISDPLLPVAAIAVASAIFAHMWLCVLSHQGFWLACCSTPIHISLTSVAVIVSHILVFTALALCHPLVTSLPCPTSLEWTLTVLIFVLAAVSNLPLAAEIVCRSSWTINKATFWLPSLQSVLPVQWIINNFKMDGNHQACDEELERLQRTNNSTIFICTTMYREEEDEMRQYLRSVRRVNKQRSDSGPSYEIHIFVDGGVKNSRDVKPQYQSFSLQLIVLLEEMFNVNLKTIRPTVTPYGVKVSVALKNRTCQEDMEFVIHMKDNAIVKKKKRWSQIMYMTYVVDHVDIGPRENRYIMITDGDVSFRGDGPKIMLDALLLDDKAGAVTARVRPMFAWNPLVWYQIFEYAATFWLYKASNDILGSELCCSGCFTMYRASCLHRVMRSYATDTHSARDFFLVDMGEDLWLSTLLLRGGYRLKYCSATRCDTNVPRKLDEFYRQRRRWSLSNLAYFLTYVVPSLSRFKYGNPHLSLPFLIYQCLLNFMPLVATTTVFSFLCAGITYAYQLNPLLPGGIFLSLFVLQHIVCFSFRDRTQIWLTVLLSILPTVIMLILLGTIVTNMWKEFETLSLQHLTQTWSPSPYPLTVSTLVFLGTIGLLFVCALVHPLEALDAAFVVVHAVGLPLCYVMLRVYVVINMADQSWGTREQRKQPAQKVLHKEFVLPRNDFSDTASDWSRTTTEIIWKSSSSEFHHSKASSDNLQGELQEMKLSEKLRQRCLQLLNMLSAQPLSALDASEQAFWTELIERRLSAEASSTENERLCDLINNFRTRMLIIYAVANVAWLALIVAVWYACEVYLREFPWASQFGFVVVFGSPCLLVFLLQFLAMLLHRARNLLFVLSRTDLNVGSALLFPSRQVAARLWRPNVRPKHQLGT